MVSTHLKNISQIGPFPQIGIKIKNIWNYHLVYVHTNILNVFGFLHGIQLLFYRCFVLVWFGCLMVFACDHHFWNPTHHHAQVILTKPFSAQRIHYSWHSSGISRLQNAPPKKRNMPCSQKKYFKHTMFEHDSNISCLEWSVNSHLPIVSCLRWVKNLISCGVPVWSNSIQRTGKGQDEQHQDVEKDDPLKKTLPNLQAFLAVSRWYIPEN